jgi:hypothetical protein
MITTSRLNIRHTHPVATLANGVKIYADLSKAPLSTNISRNPHLLNLLEEAIDNLEPTKPVIKLECDMKRTVGYTDIIATNPADTVFYARQNKGSNYTRFVKNRKSDQATTISLILARDEAGDYELQNVWVGTIFPAVPGEPDETADSKAFWESHAVIHNGQPLISSTITKTCPY